MNLKQIIREYVKQFLNENKVITEGASDILYHFTSKTNLINILKKNEFNLTFSIGDSPDFNVNRNKFFYFSTTRSKSSGFKKGNVKLVLDGRKLKNNYKLIPVDYWRLKSLKNSEQEDRIISDKPIIPNAINYILEIHMKDNTEIISNKEIYFISKKYNIPLFFYENEKDFLLQTNNKEINFNNKNNSLEYDSETKNYENPYKFFDLASLIAFNDNQNYKKIIDILIDNEKELNDFNNTLKKETQDYFKIGAPYYYEFIFKYDSLISNLRRGDENKYARSIINLLVQDLKKYKVNNLKDYLLKKQFINKKTKKDFKQELINSLINEIDNQIPNYLDKYLNKWIEIDGEYFNKIYESDQIISIFNKQINKLKEIIKNVIININLDIISDNNLFAFEIKEELEKFEKNKLIITDLLNITDIYYSDPNELNELFEKIIYFLISDLISLIYEKLKNINIEYTNQFNDN